MSSTSQKRPSKQPFPFQTNKEVRPSSISNSLPSNISCYLLEDYAFLNEYQLLQSPLNSEFQFLARIKTTQQLVRFKKRQLLPLHTPRGQQMYNRFQALFILYQKGVILADNIFILQQAHNQNFYYIIEPYLSPNQTDCSFLTLQQYLFQNRTSLRNNFELKKSLFIKCKNLLDNLSLYDIAYCGLNSRKVVVDDQGNVFLLPFELETQLINQPYQRAYYSPQVLSYLTQQQQHLNLSHSILKWDIWSFGCIALDMFLYLTPCFLSTSIERQLHKIKNQIPNVFKDFQSEFLRQNSSDDNILQNQEQSTSAKDKQKILNFLVNIFHHDINKRQFSFEPLHKEAQLLKCSKAKSSIKRLLQRSKQKLGAKTDRRSSVRNTSIQSSTILKPSSQVSNFKQLNICQKGNRKNDKLKSPQDMYSFQIRLKTLVLQTRPECQSHSQLKIAINFANGQKFQFFIAFPLQNTQQAQLSINRKITFLQRQYKFIGDLLEQDIQITLSIIDNSAEQEKQSEILISLSALMIKNEKGERLWKKPIKGTYQSQKNSDFQCKLKIEAEILELYPNQNNLSQLRQSKVQMAQEKIEKNFSIVQWLQDTGKITEQDVYRQNFTQQIQTSRFESPLQQQKIVEQKEPQNRISDHQKKSIYKFSQINSQLDQISTYWRQRISKQQSQQNQKQQQQIIEPENALKQVKIESNMNIELNQENKGKLKTKVKKILQQNKRNQKITEPVDLSNRLKRLLMR